MASFTVEDLKQRLVNDRKRNQLDEMEALLGVESAKLQAFTETARKRLDREEAIRADAIKRAEQAREAVAKERAKAGEEGAGDAEPLLNPVDVNAAAPQVSPTNMNDVVQPGQAPGQAANQIVAQASPVAGGGTQAGPGAGGIGGTPNVMGLPVPPMLQREVREETVQPMRIGGSGFIPAATTSTRTETEPNVLTAAQALMAGLRQREIEAEVAARSRELGLKALTTEAELRKAEAAIGASEARRLKSFSGIQLDKLRGMDTLQQINLRAEDERLKRLTRIADSVGPGAKLEDVKASNQEYLTLAPEDRTEVDRLIEQRDAKRTDSVLNGLGIARAAYALEKGLINEEEYNAYLSGTEKGKATTINLGNTAATTTDIQTSVREMASVRNAMVTASVKGAQQLAGWGPLLDAKLISVRENIEGLGIPIVSDIARPNAEQKAYLAAYTNSTSHLLRQFSDELLTRAGATMTANEKAIVTSFQPVPGDSPTKLGEKMKGLFQFSNYVVARYMLHTTRGQTPGTFPEMISPLDLANEMNTQVASEVSRLTPLNPGVPPADIRNAAMRKVERTLNLTPGSYNLMLEYAGLLD